jgi:hypothetical protein
MGILPLFAALIAQQVPKPQIPATVSPCGLASGLPCGSGGAAGATSYVVSYIVPALETAFLALAIIYFFYYAVRLLLESEEDSIVSETKSAYGYAIAGAVVVSVSGLIVQAVGPGFAAATLINDQPIISGLDVIVFYIRLMTSAAVSAGIVYLGFRIILLQGDEGEISEQKKRFFNGLIGVAVVTLGNIIVEGFLPTSGPGVLTLQLVGIANYLLQIFGALCVVAFLAAGFMLVISTDEALKDRAKKAMFTTTIALIVVLSCLVIVNFVVAL